MGADIPKQFLLLNEQPVVIHTLEAFQQYDSAIEMVLVLPSQEMDRWSELSDQFGWNHIRTAEGGATRFDSVQNGLRSLSKDIHLVAIHDAVRPLVSQATIARAFDSAAEKGSGIPVIPVSSSIRKVDGELSEVVDRNAYKLVQTPQAFQLTPLLSAYSSTNHNQHTDDASVFESAGHAVYLVAGNEENIKITTPIDLATAALQLNAKDHD